MKKVLLLFGMVLMMVMSMQAQTVYFTDGFENGFAEGWTQEYFDVVKGAWVTETPDISQPWKTESGDELSHPDKAVVGKGRAYFRQEPKEGKNVQTTGYRTRLITPVMDLSIGYQPILRFYHAQAKWTADFDTLRIYYRSGAGTQWNLLTEYTDYIQKWTFEEIDLPLAGAGYQLAFEADENMGRGIVLDSVLVRTKPQITVPHDISMYDMRDNGANIMWEASKDAEFFHFVMATKDLDLNVDPEAIHADSVIFVDSTVESSIQDIRVENLVPGTTYYIQIQSIGESENSTWSPTFSFKVKSVKYVPYFENFNIPYKSNAWADTRLPSWTWGSSNGIGINEGYGPVIPLWIGEEYYEWYSPDKTPFVAFIWQKKYSSGAFTTANNTMVPAGQFSYMASPEISGKGIDNFSMSMCHVTFWGTTYDKKQTYAQSIIVGVMDDPEDPTTFVAVDTCRVWGYKSFEFFDVDLSSYQGTGRYVAFASNFTDADNQYFIDNVTIELRPAVSAVSRQNVRVVPDTTAAALLWPAANGAVSYKVKYAKMESKGSSVPLYAKDVIGETVTTDKPEILLQNLTPRQQYIFTIQAVGADTMSAWSQPMNFFTSAEIELPYMTSFEEAEGTYSMEGAASVFYPINWLSYSNDADYPYMHTSYMKTGQRAMYLVKDVGNDSWMVSPMIENLTGQEMFFYLKTSSATYDGSKALVGVMEDPSDLSTFTPIATFTATSADFVKCYVNFLNYQGPGKYIAIVWGEIGNGQKNTLVIDDLTIQEVGSCFAPTLTVEGVTDNYAKISWLQKEPSDLYQVKVFTNYVKEGEIETKTGNVLDIASQDSTNLVLDSINYATSYYVYVRVLCSEEDKSDWAMASFKTECPALMKLPFTDGFETCGTSTGNHPDCWTVPDWSSINTSGNNYPYGYTSYKHSGAKSLNMYSYTTYGSMIALPQLDADIADVKLSFWAYSSSSGYKVITGYMTDPNDLYSFVPVDTFLTTTSWTKHDVIFHGISGRDKYIAITTFTGASNTVYIDDVEVTDLTDAAPFNYQKKDATTSFMDFTWDGKTTDKWQIVASKTRYDLWKQIQTEEGKDTTVAFDPWTEIPDEDIVGKGEVAANEFIIPNGLEAMTWYYVYGHSTNGTDWSMDSVQTECTTWNPRVKMTEGFESYGPTATSTLTGTSGNEIAPNWWEKALVPTCWTVGNAKGCDPSVATTYTIRGYYPYVMSNGTVSVTSGKVNTTNYYDKGTALPGKSTCYAPNGYNCLKLYGSYSATATSNYAPAYAAMNKLECSDADLKSLIVTGSYKKASTAGYALIVGVMDDPTDLSTFTVLDSLIGGNGTSGTSQVVNFEVSLENYEGTGRYIAFRTSYGKTMTVYLDDVCVSLASCPKPKPSVSGMTDNSAIISSGLKVENPWKYIVTGKKYDVAALDEGTMPGEDITVVPLTQVGTWDDEAPKRVQVSNLAADSTYYVYVMTLCAEDASSAWVETSFTTLCEDKDITTWTYDFSDDATTSGTIPGCWTVGNMGPGATSTYIPYPQACVKLGKNGLKLYSYRASATNANGAYAVTPGMAVPAGKRLQNYQVEFDAFGASTATATSRTETEAYEYFVEVGVVEDPHDLSTVQMLDTIYLPLDVQHCVVPLDEYEGNGKFIIFKNEILFETTATGNNYAWIGNIKFSELPACQTPMSLDIAAVTSNTVDLKWSGKSAKYNVAISSKKYEDDEKDFIFANDSAIAADGIVMQTVSTNTAHFEGLESNTAYYAYVRGICSETEYSVWSYGAMMFKTDCNPKEPIPFRCDFNNNSATGGGKRPDCWLGVYHTFGSGTFNLTSYPYVLATASKAYGGVGYSLEMMSSSTYNNYSVLPMIDADLNEMIISFYATNYSAYAGRHVHIGYTTDWSSNQAIVDSCVFIGAIELPNSNVYTDKFEFHFADAEKKVPANARLILAANYTLDGLTSGSVDILIDNVYVGLPPTCYAPTNTSVSEIGFSAATFNFTPYKETDIAWDVELTNLVTNEVKMTTISKYPYQIEGLDAGTAYSVRVRTNCGDEDVSEWTDAVNFSTKYIIDTYKWTFNLNEQGTISVPSKEGAAVATYALHPALTIDVSDTTWHYSSNTTCLPYQVANTTIYTYSFSDSTSTEKRALRFYTTAVYDTAAVILPIISNPSDKMLSLDVRGGYMYSPEHSTESNRNKVGTYAYPNSILSIGTVDSLKGIETYQEIMKWQPSALMKNDSLREASFFGWDHIILPLKDINLQQKQLVLLMGNCGTAYMHIDNLGIEKDTLGFTSPYISGYKVADTNITLSWTGTATEYNIYKVDINKMGDAAPACMPYLQDAPDSIVTKIEHVTGNTYKVEGLEPGMQYEFYVEDAAHAAVRGALSNRKIVKTVCQAMNGAGFATSFELGPDDKIDTNPSKSSLTNYYWQWPTSTTAGDTAYLMPNCWNYGITYASYDKESATYKSYNPSVKQKTPTYAYALTGRNAFQFYGTSTYKELYAVMPLLNNIDFDTTEVCFYGRCSYEYSDEYSTASYRGRMATTTYLKGTSYSTKLAVGTMTDPEDISTFVALDTVEYDYTSADFTSGSSGTLAADDPANLRFFQKFAVSLKGATGDYIAFKQVGYGYFYMDDLCLQKIQTPRKPADLVISDVTSKTANVTWTGKMEGGRFVLELSTDKTTWLNPRRDTTETTSFHYDNLAVNQKYFVRVKQIETELGNTDYAHYEEFTTECEALNPNGYYTGFECNNENDKDPWSVIPGATGTNVNTMKQNQCWSYINQGTTQTVSSSYFPYNIVNTATVGYNHSGNYACKLNAYSTTYQHVIVSPMIDAEIGQAGVGFDTLQISFWACPSPHGLGTNTNKGKISTASGNTYGKYIEIGTCTDPNDPTTYTILQTWTYVVDDDNLKAGTKADETNDYAFRKVTVKLNKATGPYVFIRANKERPDKTFTYSTMYIDDLQFERLTNCEPATDLTAENITVHDADLSWKSEAMFFNLQVSTDGTFTDTDAIVLDTTGLDTTFCHVEGLEASKMYYFRVKAQCDEAGEDVSDWTVNAYFRTPFAPLFEEQFTTTDYLSENKGWKGAYGYADKIFAGEAQLRDTTTSGTYNSWYRVQNTVMTGYAVVGVLGYAGSANPTWPISSTYKSETYNQKYWLVSPAITIEEGKGDVQLSFLYGLANYYNTTDPITVYEHWNEGWDDQFMVIVSEDGGETWKRENATIWNNETTNDPADDHYVYGIGDYRLTEIPNTATEMNIDLNKYAGKTIKIAFYRESKETNSIYGVHLDRIHVNYVEKQHAEMTQCQYEDIEDVLGFTINGDTVQAGMHNLKRSVLSSEQGTKDSLFLLDANYLDAPEYYYDITVCKGHPFTYMGFNEHTAPGTYRMKLTSAVTGCDSLVNFTIRHTPAFETVIDTTLCYGGTITIGDKVYDKAGNYVDTLQSCELLGGCDSIVRLTLRITDAIRTQQNVSFCNGSEYTWHDPSGVYPDTTINTPTIVSRVFVSASGCDSTVTLNAVMNYPQTVTIEDTICQGKSRRFAGVEYKESGTYEYTTPSKLTGCDSTTILKLYVEPAPVEYVDTAICDGSSFKAYSKTFFSTGIYRDTTYNEEGCMAIMEVDLKVNPKLLINLEEEICEGQKYALGDTVYATSGYYTYTTASLVTGCDSTTTLALKVNPAPKDTTTEITCANKPYIFYGKEYKATGIYNDTTVSEEGCWAIHTLDLSVQSVSSVNEAKTICQGQSCDFKGQILTKSGTYKDTVYYTTGCDSVITTLVLTVTPAEVASEKVAICDGESYDFGGKQLSQAGYYRDTTYSEEGCMQITELILTINPKYSFSQGTKYINQGDSYEFYGKQLTTSGYYTENLKTVHTDCDSIWSVNLVVLTDVTGSEEYTVCESQLPFQWKNSQYEKEGVYEFDTLTTYGTDSTVILTLHVTKTQRSNIMADFCEGSSYDFNGKKLTVEGTYFDTISVCSTGCDSIITLALKMNEAPVNRTKETICEGTSYEFGGKMLTEAGIYRDTTYEEGTHCMQIDELTLSINPKLTAEIRVSICEGASYEFGDQTYTKGGNYTYTTASEITGCDSTTTLILTVNPAPVVPVTNTICEGTSYEFGGKTLTAAGIYRDTTYEEETHCMTITELKLSVNPKLTAEIRESICEGASYEFGNQTYTKSGNYTYTTASEITGCDSTTTLILTVNPAPVDKQEAAICEGGSYEFAGKQLTTAGVYRDTTYAEETHCMAITELTLTVNRPVFVNLNKGICEGESYEFNGEILTQTCNRSMTVPSVITGCDSTTNLALMVYPKSQITVPASICEGDSLEAPDGTFLKEAGEYTFNLTSVLTDCDSIVTISLKVNTPKNETRDVAICAGSTYLFNDKELDQPGTYLDTVPDVNGCMAVITLNLTVNEPLTGEQHAEFCSEYNYQGKTYTEPGTYLVELKTEAGCDSIVSLILVQTKDVHDTLYVTVCKGETYEDENFSVSEPGVYYAESVLPGGCTAYHVLYFGNYPDELIVDTTILLKDLPYTYPGTSIYYGEQTEEGDYYDEVQMISEQGCNVTLRHTLHVRESTSIIDVYYESDGTQVLKVIHKEHLYIIRKGVWYDATGKHVVNPK